MHSPFDVFDLSGKVAVVTGAGSGIGAAVASVLGAAGAAVIGGDIRTDGIPDGTTAVTCDVSRREDVFALAARAQTDHGRLDVWCNVAGVAADGKIADINDAAFDRAVAINLRGVLYGCQAAIGV